MFAVNYIKSKLNKKNVNDYIYFIFKLMPALTSFELKDGKITNLKFKSLIKGTIYFPRNTYYKDCLLFLELLSNFFHNKKFSSQDFQSGNISFLSPNFSEKLIELFGELQALNEKKFLTKAYLLFESFNENISFLNKFSVYDTHNEGRIVFTSGIGTEISIYRDLRVECSDEIKSLLFEKELKEEVILEIAFLKTIFNSTSFFNLMLEASEAFVAEFETNLNDLVISMFYCPDTRLSIRENKNRLNTIAMERHALKYKPNFLAKE